MLSTLIPTPWPIQFNGIFRIINIDCGYDPLHIQSAAECEVQFTNLQSHSQCQTILTYMSARVIIIRHVCENHLGGHNCNIVYETPILVQCIPGIFPPFWGPGDLPFQALASHNVQGLNNPHLLPQVNNPYQQGQHHQDNQPNHQHQQVQHPEIQHHIPLLPGANVYNHSIQHPPVLVPQPAPIPVVPPIPLQQPPQPEYDPVTPTASPQVSPDSADLSLSR